MKRKPRWLRIPKWIRRAFKIIVPSFTPIADPRFDRLHELLESDGEMSEVQEHVVGLTIECYGYAIRTMKELRKRTTENRVLYGICIALAIGGAYTYDGVRDAQRRSLVAAQSANDATHQLALFTAQNRILIARLDNVAKEAQENGRQTSRVQCREIEKVKSQIRAVISASPTLPADLRAQDLARFKRRACDKLPNSKVVKP